VRARRGQAPLPDGLGEKARIYGAQAIPLDEAGGPTPTQPPGSPPETAAAAAPMAPVG
jgi:hypothetical protein